MTRPPSPFLRSRDALCAAAPIAWRAVARMALALLAMPALLHAQQLAPKPTLVTSGPAGCASFPAPTAAGSQSPLTDDAETRRLIDQAQEATLQGEHAAARDAFAQAAKRSPGDARVAYYLGREYEALSQATEAVREYCRYLALSPRAPDGDEVRGRIVRLVPSSELARVDEARANFRSGVALLERHQFVAADSVFSAVASSTETAPEVYFNRALARAARGERTSATQDFEKYLELLPTASDRGTVLSAMTRLQDRVFNPGQALASGLVVPGMGQMQTGRPVLGVLVLGAVAGATAFGLAQTTGYEHKSYTDPFGRTYQDSLPTTSRPNFAIAAAGAAALWIGAAIEASSYARRTRTRAEGIIALGDAVLARSRLVVARRGRATLLGVAVRLGSQEH